MEKQTIRTVEFLSPGSFTANMWTKPIETCELAHIEWPDNAYAFRFYEREDVTIDGKVYTGESKQIGPLFYHPDSVVEDIEAVKLNPRSTPTLVTNMRCNGWDRIVWSRWGTWPQRFDSSEMVVLPK